MIQTQLNNILNMLFVCAFILGANLTVTIVHIWIKTREEKEEDAGIYEEGAISDVPSVRAAEEFSLPDPSRLRDRIDYPRRAARSILDRHRSSEAEE